MKISRRIVAFALLVLGFAEVQAQTEPSFCINGITATGERCANAVTSAVPFLRIIADARGGAMGDVGIATSADPNGMHYNQSKLAFMTNPAQFSATYTPWMQALGLNDVYLAYLTGAFKLDELQSLGFELRYFSLGDIPFTSNDGEPLGEGKPNELGLTFAYARKLSETLSVGLGGKFIYSNLAAGQIVDNVRIRAGIAGAADLSMTYKTPVKFTKKDSEFTLGAAISNIGSKISYTQSINREYIPTNLGLGLAWKFNLDEFNTLTITSDFNKLLLPTPNQIDEDPKDNVYDYKQLSPISAVFTSFGDAPGGFAEELNEITTGIGLEYWYDEQFAVRTGYFYEHYSKGNRKYFTVGLGVKYNLLGLNISYLVPTTNQRNPLDNTLRFSLLFDMNSFSEE